MHPMIEEMCRAKDLSDVRPDVFRRWQQTLRAEIQPKLDELETWTAKAAPKERSK